MSGYTIEYTVPSGRTYQHTGSEDGIRKLVQGELKGCKWVFIGRSFEWNKKENAA